MASARLGGAALEASDEFFASRENLVNPARPIWDEDRYTDRGKWMDGWESRRHRAPDYDWCVVRLGLPGVVDGVVVDTAYFRGNYPEECSLDGCAVAEGQTWQEAEWMEILPRRPLQGNFENKFAIECPYRLTHVRLNIYPDGGVARLRVHGQAVPEWMAPGTPPEELDLAALQNGAEALLCSDMFFSSRHNLVMTGHATHMGDGWETRRRRAPGHEWAIVRLATEGIVEQVDVDTSHFKGNAPKTCWIEVCTTDELSAEHAEWRPLLSEVDLSPDRLHRFFRKLEKAGPATHLRVNIAPCGGVARLRAWGVTTENGRIGSALRWLNTLFPAAAAEMLKRCCGSTKWTERMVAARPFTSPDHLFENGDQIWWELEESDWREAFAAHPPIGSRKENVHQDAHASEWSRKEQAGTAATGAAVLTRLEEANREYRDKFGYTFIVCATGRTGDEMLEILETRLRNEPAAEVRRAATEQSAITRLRLEKLLRSPQ